VTEQKLLHHATRMAAITFISRLTGWLRDKVLAWVLGAGVLNDAFRTAFRIPNAFRALLAEGALHAAFVPTLARLDDEGDAGREARELVRGVTAALGLALAVVVGFGIALSPWLVRLYAEGFSGVPGKLEVTVLMNRLMFPYLGFISLAALCQGVLNSRERFLLPAATPVVFNLLLSGVAWFAVRGSSHAPEILSMAVLGGGALQFGIQLPSVRRLGFSLRPLWSAAWSPGVRRVLGLMLPGIAVLGINQVNQLVTSRFASYLGDGGVTVQYYAYRVTELVFGGIIVQLTTVLLPVLARQLRTSPEEAPQTLLDTVRLVSFVTLPSATLLLVASRPVSGFLFGGGRFDDAAVAVTAATLAGYAFGLVGTAHAKVMASSFFAQGNTKTPMWCTALTLVVFTACCAALVGPLGVPGLGLANTVAMSVYAVILTLWYLRRYGLGATRIGPTAAAVGRQVVASALVGGVLWSARGPLAEVDHTGVREAAIVALVVLGSGVGYAALVRLMGGREPAALVAAMRRGSPS
jgi:putative peptidoglycan lipid II flippase